MSNKLIENVLLNEYIIIDCAQTIYKYTKQPYANILLMKLILMK